MLRDWKPRLEGREISGGTLIRMRSAVTFRISEKDEPSDLSDPAVTLTNRGLASESEIFPSVDYRLQDRIFGVIGSLFIIIFLVPALVDYRNFPHVGPYFRFADGREVFLPFVRILTDWTYIMVLLGFCFRRSPVLRNRRAADVTIALIGSYWLAIPFVIAAGCGLIDGVLGTRWHAAFLGFWMPGSLGLGKVLVGSALVTCGNLLDIWGYGALFRSFSLVPEARELCTRGPFRFVRHPIYLGQIMAQAGIFLCFASLHPSWILFWLTFCLIQLRRAWREDRVLETAFGRRFRNWKEQTAWIW